MDYHVICDCHLIFVSATSIMVAKVANMESDGRTQGIRQARGAQVRSTMCVILHICS